MFKFRNPITRLLITKATLLTLLDDAKKKLTSLAHLTQLFDTTILPRP